MNSMKIGTYQMDTTFGLYLPEYTIPAPAVQTNFVKIIGRDGSVDLSNALGLHYDSRTWSLDFKCFDPTVNWHTLSSRVMNAIHGKRLNFEFDDDPNYFWTGRVSVQNYVSNHGTGTLRVTIVSDPFKYAKLSTIVTKTASTGTEYTGSMVTFNDGLIYDLSADIEPIQDLHGYDSPWVGTEQDKVPYNFRALPDPDTTEIGNSEIGKIVGGTVAWNQLAPAVTSENWDKSGSGSLSVEFSNGEAICTNLPSSWCGIATKRNWTGAKAGHKYLVSVIARVVTDGDSVTIGTGAFSNGDNIGTVSSTTKTIIQKIFAPQADKTGRFNIGNRNSSNSFAVSCVNVFDLTQMFGSTIADYIYSLEQATEGAGVAWFKKLFPKDYYAYDAGSLLSVKTTAHKEVGFNQLDESTLYQFGTSNVMSHKIPVVPGMTYELRWDNGLSFNGIYIVEYDSNDTQVKQNAVYNSIYTSLIATISSNTSYVVLNYYKTGSSTPNISLSDVISKRPCFHLVWDGERDGEYEPYEANTYALDDVELRGIPKLDANNNLYYDGDSYAPDGTVTRKYGTTTLGAMGWAYNSTYGRFESMTLRDSIIPVDNSGTVSEKLFCGGIYTVRPATNTGSSPIDKTISVMTGGYIFVRDESYTDVQTWLAAVGSTPLVYGLLTPTTESADPYTSPQSVSPYGTEEYVDAGVAAGTRDVAIPVGHETTFANICPISGRTGLSVYVGPTTAQADATTYAVDWTDEAGTVYGGTLDVVTGVLTVDRAVVDLGTLNWSATGDRFTVSQKLVPNPVTKAAWDVSNPMAICSMYKYGNIGNGNGVDKAIGFYNGYLYARDTAYSTAADFESAMSGVQLVYELATPLTYQLTPQEVEALVGTNNVWSDGGNVTVAVVTPETLTNNGRAVVPTLTASADMVLKWGNYSASVQQGTSTIPQLILENGANLIYIIGTGSISFTWQEASL